MEKFLEVAQNTLKLLAHMAFGAIVFGVIGKLTGDFYTCLFVGAFLGYFIYSYRVTLQKWEELKTQTLKNLNITDLNELEQRILSFFKTNTRWVTIEELASVVGMPPSDLESVIQFMGTICRNSKDLITSRKNYEKLKSFLQKSKDSFLNYIE